MPDALGRSARALRTRETHAHVPGDTGEFLDSWSARCAEIDVRGSRKISRRQEESTIRSIRKHIAKTYPASRNGFQEVAVRPTNICFPKMLGPSRPQRHFFFCDVLSSRALAVAPARSRPGVDEVALTAAIRCAPWRRALALLVPRASARVGSGAHAVERGQRDAVSLVEIPSVGRPLSLYRVAKPAGALSQD